MYCSTDHDQLIICETKAYKRHAPKLNPQRSICRQFLRDLDLSQLYYFFRDLTQIPVQVIKYDTKDYLVYFTAVCPSTKILQRQGFKELPRNHTLVKRLVSKMKPDYLKFIFGGIFETLLTAALYQSDFQSPKKVEISEYKEPDNSDLLDFSKPQIPKLPDFSEYLKKPENPNNWQDLYDRDQKAIQCLYQWRDDNINEINQDSKLTPEEKNKTKNFISTRTKLEVDDLINNPYSVIMLYWKLKPKINKILETNILRNMRHNVNNIKLKKAMDNEFNQLVYAPILEAAEREKKILITAENKFIYTQRAFESSTGTSTETSSETSSGETPKNIGLTNIAYICFSNVLLQLLYNIPEVVILAKSLPPLIRYFITNMQKLKDGEAFTADQKIVASYYQQCFGVFGMQQDSSELWESAFIRPLSADLNQFPMGTLDLVTSNPLLNLFAFENHQTQICFRGLNQVEISPAKNSQIAFTLYLNIDVQEPSQTIQNLYNKALILTPLDVESCPLAAQQTRYFNFGPYLVVCLLRFEFDRIAHKIQTAVSAEEILIVGKDIRFQLIGIILHVGTIQYGHYVYFKKQEDGKWTLLDDRKIITNQDAPMYKWNRSMYNALHHGYIYLYKQIRETKKKNVK